VVLIVPVADEHSDAATRAAEAHGDDLVNVDAALAGGGEVEMSNKLSIGPSTETHTCISTGIGRGSWCLACHPARCKQFFRFQHAM
jgi:hypothetical protein